MCRCNTKSTSLFEDMPNRIKIALQVKNNLISDVSNHQNDHKTHPSVESEYQYILHDFAGGLCNYLNNKYKTLPIQVGVSFVKLCPFCGEKKLNFFANHA